MNFLRQLINAIGCLFGFHRYREKAVDHWLVVGICEGCGHARYRTRL